jgi:hypothetical protein
LLFASAVGAWVADSSRLDTVEREMLVQRPAQAAIWGMSAVGIWNIVGTTRRACGRNRDVVV